MAPLPVMAQDVGTVQSEILVLDPERLFNETRVGQRLIQQYQAEREKLIASNRTIEAELRAEEQSLTDSRPNMSPEDFRNAADAFDAKVRDLRADNERRAIDLERGREIAPLSLMRMSEPILIELMRDAGGTIILDSRQVLLRANVIDITDLAISRVDAAIGDGSGQVPGLEGGASAEDRAPAQDAVPEAVTEPAQD
ncbi:OmpH family outer membrane protein [Roseovarius sp. LXJ103]|uniref:OmpH family outer membrane protein n=1 Tax=Roseovarius carneus TaxID=2853164 RepID=UPI0015E7F02B|nr:OmpH family outer membrane protein [Roseovarius carneus]MBZ8119466.1 OmpH family outer membrane protein [Roseovarius carneus]